MIPTPVALFPPNEAERLQGLHELDIIHSLQEDVFDEVVILTAHLFGLPISYVALVDSDYQYYKAVHGFDLPPPQVREELLCAQVVKHNKTVLYHDLSAAPQLPLDGRAIRRALASQVRFYVGAPLHTADQYAIGTLCLAGPQPRSFSAQEQQVLERIAAIVSALIVLRRQCLSAPTHGETHWKTVRNQVRDEVHALRALVRYLLTRYGALVPVPDEILHLVTRRLQDLQGVIQEYTW